MLSFLTNLLGLSHQLMQGLLLPAFAFAFFIYHPVSPGHHAIWDPYSCGFRSLFVVTLYCSGLVGASFDSLLISFLAYFVDGFWFNVLLYQFLASFMPCILIMFVSHPPKSSPIEDYTKHPKAVNCFWRVVNFNFFF